MIPGDLLKTKSKIQVGVVRIYTDDQCEGWETHMGQDVLKVLFPWGIRWVYKLDMEVLQ